jgi:hypothetical protein
LSHVYPKRQKDPPPPRAASQGVNQTRNVELAAVAPAVPPVDNPRTFAKFSVQRGFTAEEIAVQLPNVSSKARERMLGNDPGYVTKTAENGVDAANRGKHRSRA